MKVCPKCGRFVLLLNPEYHLRILDKKSGEEVVLNFGGPEKTWCPKCDDDNDDSH